MTIHSLNIFGLFLFHALDKNTTIINKSPVLEMLEIIREKLTGQIYYMINLSGAQAFRKLGVKILQIDFNLPLRP